jgi:hypothetical protein
MIAASGNAQSNIVEPILREISGSSQKDAAAAVTLADHPTLCGTRLSAATDRQRSPPEDFAPQGYIDA